MCVYATVLHACKCQKRTEDLLVLNLEATVNQLTWVLETEFGSLEVRQNDLNC